MQEKTKQLNLMRFWLFGSFVIIAAALVTVGFFIPGLMQELFYWLAIAAAAVITVFWYFIYRWWLGRKGEQAAPAMGSTPATDYSDPDQSGE